MLIFPWFVRFFLPNPAGKNKTDPVNIDPNPNVPGLNPSGP